MTRRAPTTVQYVQLMELLMPVFSYIYAEGNLTSQDVCDLLRAGRLAREFEQLRDDGVLMADFTLAQYVALVDTHAVLTAQEAVSAERSRLRQVLVAIGELEADDA